MRGQIPRSGLLLKIRVKLLVEKLLEVLEEGIGNVAYEVRQYADAHISYYSLQLLTIFYQTPRVINAADCQGSQISWKIGYLF